MYQSSSEGLAHPLLGMLPVNPIARGHGHQQTTASHRRRPVDHHQWVRAQQGVHLWQWGWREAAATKLEAIVLQKGNKQQEILKNKIELI